MKRVLGKISAVRIWLYAHPLTFAALTVVVGLEIIGWTYPLPADAATVVTGKFDPDGFGSLFNAPDLAAGQGKTLYEAYSTSAYTFTHWYGDIFGPDDYGPYVLLLIAELLLGLLMALVQGAIVVVWQIASFQGFAVLSTGIADALEVIANNLVGWLLPSALAIGGLIAYLNHRRADGGTLNQLAWVLVAAVAATTLAAQPVKWVDAVTGLKDIGTTGVAQASATAVQGIEIPFKGNVNPTYGSNENDNLMRKIGDSSWRAFVVTPWCIANFGSMEACKALGPSYLDANKGYDAIEEWTQNAIESNGLSDSDPAYGYLQSTDAAGPRASMMLFAVVVGLLFALLAIYLSIIVIISLGSALLLLLVGALFVMMWCIPGRPRQWGINWLEELIGLIFQSVIALLVLVSTLTLTAIAFTQTATLGWMGATMLALAIMISGFSIRAIINRIMGIRGAGGAAGFIAMMAGARAARALGGRARNIAGRAGRGMKRAGSEGLRKMGDTMESRSAQGLAQMRAHAGRRTFAAAGSHSTRPAPGGPRPAGLPSGPSRPALPPGAGSFGAITAGPRPRPPAPAGAAKALPAAPLSTRPYRAAGAPPPPPAQSSSSSSQPQVIPGRVVSSTTTAPAPVRGARRPRQAGVRARRAAAVGSARLRENPPPPRRQHGAVQMAPKE